jgi:hypothetical protein
VIPTFGELDRTDQHDLLNGQLQHVKTDAD